MSLEFKYGPSANIRQSFADSTTPLNSLMNTCNTWPWRHSLALLAPLTGAIDAAGAQHNLHRLDYLEVWSSSRIVGGCWRMVPTWIPVTLKFLKSSIDVSARGLKSIFLMRSTGATALVLIVLPKFHHALTSLILGVEENP